LVDDGELHVVTPGVCPDSGVKLATTLAGVEVGKGVVIEVDLAGEQREGLWLSVDPWFAKGHTNAREDWPQKTGVACCIALPVAAWPHGRSTISLLVKPEVVGFHVSVTLRGVVPSHNQGVVDPKVLVLKVFSGWSWSNQERMDANTAVDNDVVVHLNSVVGQEVEGIVICLVNKEASEHNAILVLPDFHGWAIGVDKDSVLHSMDDIVGPSLA